MKQIVTGLLLFALGFSGGAHGADKNALFQDDSVVKAVLTAPITQAYAQRGQDVRIYLPGQWTYTAADGTTQRLDVSIRTRGLFRREYCQLPPLQLNFKKGQVKKTLFAGQNKLKVVSPCQNGAKSQQHVVLEYLAYRTFEILTDHSFGTRLIRLSYVDSDEKMAPWTDLVFVIEDDNDMAKRLGLTRLKVVSNRFDQMDHTTTALVDLFQLLIANNDYSVLRSEEGRECCHNSEILALKENADVRIPVPYDFDLSGLVDTKYAAPPSYLPTRFVTTRYYRGLCQPPGVLEDAIARVQSRREDIIGLFANSRELESKTKKKTLKFIEDYFEILDDPKRMKKEIAGRCRGKEHLEKMLSKG
ncbi:MAG: hypothetical protein KJO01_13155 [Gammaproteobacteria bacterium]|nr:hypothetical protein [Gammaproteobacteria bacterium]MBT8111031.1 hypothetical protein [Gammaproteobacteria bacterium]NND48467.1 hypothetical protein [Woeseiaceae bacterium]NNL45729.1 hypothetical protein [Woeseiaceae bacterium]